MYLSAEWRPNDLRYHIEYELNGGKLEEPNPETVLVGQTLSLKEPLRNGYIFLGWYDNAEGTGTCYEYTPVGRETDLFLYALWQEIVVSGNYKDFTYEKGFNSVTITGYTGLYGENVDLVIPSYIDGKPVVAVDGSIHRSPESHNPVSLRAVNIPDTVKKLGAEAFTLLTVSEPLTIPASVEEIGVGCLSSVVCRLYFEEGSRLTSIGAGAFGGSTIKNAVVLPDGVRRLEQGTFSGTVLPGVILPDSLSYIATGALGCNNGAGLSLVYIPSSVEYIEPYAFEGGAEKDVVYISSEAQAEKFAADWAGSAYYDRTAEIIVLDDPASGIALKDGDATYYPEGEGAFALPEPEKEGYTFLGWYSEETDFVWRYFLAPRDGLVLEAVYEEKSASDGRSRATPAAIELRGDYEFLLLPSERSEDGFWFTINGGGRVAITLEYTPIAPFAGEDDCSLEIDRGENTEYITPGIPFICEAGEVFRIYQGNGRAYGFRVTIKTERMPR